jgi:Zn-dependent protease with chaperone function
LRVRFNNEEISLEGAKKEYERRVNAQIILAIVLFTVEVFSFDLKFLIMQAPDFGVHEFIGNTLGLGVFILHLAIVWYWGFRAMGDVLQTGDSVKDHIRSNIMFNLPLVGVWLFFSLLLDILGTALPDAVELISTPPYQYIFFAFFLGIFTLFAPPIIVRLWDCRPLPSSQLKDEIEGFCRSQGVKFKGIMSWDALNKGLVTAGVIGIVAPFRYLLITPQLMNMLDKDELMAVVSHEVAHVKKRHLLLYLLFFMGFILLSGSIQDLLFDFFFTTSLGLSIITTGEGMINNGLISFVFIVVFLVTFVVYVRFIFGFFMRNFERQADGYCFESGIDPDHMVSSFMKLGVRLGDDGKKPNWHHFNLSQRIDFIRKGKENPGIISRHNKMVKRGIAAYVIALVLFSVVFFSAYKIEPVGAANLKRIAAVIETHLDEQPDNARLYSLLGTIYYQLKEWQASLKAFKYAVGLDYNQPDALNNMAWLLLTSEDESLKDPVRALKLAQDAARMSEQSHIMDTLAEAYYQNSMFREAYEAAERALKIASDNRAYYKDQLEKMKKALKEKKMKRI